MVGPTVEDRQTVSSTILGTNERKEKGIETNVIKSRYTTTTTTTTTTTREREEREKE